MHQLSIKKLSEDAQLPVRGSDGAAGYDLYSTEAVELVPGERALVGTGIAIAIPPETYARVAPRSGLAVKKGLDVLAGVVDEDYRGEVKVALINLSDSVVTLDKGERIAQLVIERIWVGDVVEVDTLPDSMRGAGGFGSTGR